MGRPTADAAASAGADEAAAADDSATRRRSRRSSMAFQASLHGVPDMHQETDPHADPKPPPRPLAFTITESGSELN